MKKARTILTYLSIVVVILFAVAGCQWAKAANSTPKNDANRKVMGIVTDENGEPLIGATVKDLSSKATTVTDIDGKFSIAVSGDGKLIVSYVGFKDVTISAVNKTMVNVQMRSNEEMLGEVVVVGYGTVKKESLTSSISTVKAEDISRSSAVNTSGALVGKVAGLNTRQSQSRPGETARIYIRNMGTPLYVVDGMQVDEGQFNNIDFNDIENISVLKDASAAIYGVKAANGVVVVTTKSGKRNTKISISANGYYGIQSMFRYPEPADAYTWAKARTQSYTVLGQTSPYTAEDLEKFKAGTEKGYQTFNWKDFIFSSAPQSYIEVSSTGGSDKISYYAALSNTKTSSIVDNYGYFQRTNLQLNVTADITKNLKFGMKVNGRLEETKHVAFNSYLSGQDAYWTAFYATMRNSPIMRPYANDNPLYPAVCAGIYTNFANLTYERSGEDSDKWRVIQGGMNLEWEPITNLKLKGLVNYMYSSRRHNMHVKGYSLYNYDELTDSYYEAVRSNSGLRQRDYANYEFINTQVSADYNVTLSDKHKIAAFIGAETYLNEYPTLSIQTTPGSDAIELLDKNDITLLQDVGTDQEARVGFMGRLNYNYDDRYLLEMAARYDGSWKFPPHKRWGFFPSISGGWRISNESFWKNWEANKFVQNLKLRASWGILGDDNVSGYNSNSFRPGYNYGVGGAVIDGQYVTGSSVRSLPITNISWIKAHTFDVGIDIGVLNNRLTAELDYFHRERKGLPAGRYDVLIPNEVGFSLPNENLNSDLVRGFDAMIRWNDKIGEFNLSIGGNITFARKYNWEQYKPTFGNSRDYYVYNAQHRLAGAVWGLVCEGQFQTWEEIAEYPVNIDGKGNTTLRPGDLIYKDLNGDGIINDDDQKAIGAMGYEDSNPPFMNFGINLSFEWKGIDFAADFSGAIKQTIVLNWEQRFPFHSDNSPINMLADQWHLSDPYDANSEYIPGHYPMNIIGQSGHSNYRFSTFWMKDVNYIKLRNLQIGYTFPKNWLKKLHVEKFRVYTLMQNLFSLDNLKYYGIDPESCQSAGFGYPSLRVYNFGFNLTF